MKKTLLLAASGFATLALSGIAAAQNVAAPTPPSPTSAMDQTAAEPEAETAGAQSDDIVVTAQGRAQVLADVPVAISAVSAETLQNSGANDIRQLNQVAPSLLVSSTGSEANGSPRIRGIGTVGDNPGLESSVVVLIDGVYRSRSGIGLNQLGEIDRIEVLRGPQGTLGGRNSSAGLLSVISKKPSFTIGASGEATYGNYDFLRLAAGVTGPITDTLAARIDGVYVKREGFYNDATNDTTVNDRDRVFLRGQLLFEPIDAVSFRLIGDFTKRDENCCAATYIDGTVNPTIGSLNVPATPLTTGLPVGNNIINVLRDLGQNIAAFSSGYNRDISVSPGRSFAGHTRDWGVSGQLDWDVGGLKLTSITAYRDYRHDQAADLDYGTVDILYNGEGGGNRRQFRTFTQELRVNGTVFDGRIDWLVGGFYLNEKFRGTSNQRFGSQYGRFATCRLVSGTALAALYNPAAAGCIASQSAFAGAFGVAGPSVLGSLLRLDAISDRGSTIDRYNQDSRSFAAFTHNIVHITDTVDLTLGVRYTNERKRFSASFGNDNTACGLNQAALTPFLANPGLAAVAGGIIGLSCQGNSTAELNGVSIADERSEDEFTGTGVLSWKPIENLLLYGSYSRGYKAGGFNFDRSALKSPTFSFASFGGGSAQAGAQALTRGLQFDAETVNAFEIGAKYATGPFSLSVAAFRQDFRNFQLNTFDGTVYIVENLNGCASSLNGGDRDQSKFPSAPNYSATAAGTGACGSDDISYGVRSQGVELETTLVPMRDFRVTAGFTYADTKFRNQLVGNASGAPLNQALRKLPGNRLSLAPAAVVTGSVAWTPDVGTTGLSALVYVDTRMTSDYISGSDLFPQKAQDGFALVNTRIGLRGPSQRWAIELWAQNVFDQDYAQVAFNSPFQEGATTPAFQDPQFPGGRQIFSNFLAEPRTYGVTLRGRF